MKKTVIDLVPEHIQRLAGYVPGKAVRQAQRESGLPMLKLASNENPFGPSPLAIAAIQATASEVNLYPDNDAGELREALADLHQLVPEQLFVADGSLGILDVMAHTLLGPGTNCVTSELTFISYGLVTRAAGGELITTPLRNDGYDLDAIAAAINEQTRIVIIANPNNPTGTMFDAEATEAFLDRVPDHVLVVLDEAYSDFAEHFARARGQVYSRSMDHVRSGRKNLMVLRTFSKAHGLAGLRLGYGCGDADLLRYFGRVRNAFSISTVAQAAGLAALRDTVHLRKTIDNNTAGAEWLLEQIKELGLRAVPTSGNFIYFEVDDDADSFAKRMQAGGVIVRSLVPWGKKNGVRVTIGTPEQNEIFVRSARKIVSQTVAR